MTEGLRLRRKLTKALGTAGGVGVVGTTQNNVDYAKTNLPGCITSPTRLLEAIEPPALFEANRASPEHTRGAGDDVLHDTELGPKVRDRSEIVGGWLTINLPTRVITVTTPPCSLTLHQHAQRAPEYQHTLRLKRN